MEFSVLFPAYTLTPHAAYPTQFQQAIDALSYVLHDLERDAQDVIITGDSAGANICVAILSHLLHPSPDVTRLQVKGKLRGVVLISPWLSFDTSWPSMTHNAEKDIDKKEALESWAKQYLNGKASDNYAEAILAPIEWWRGSQAERVLVVAGSDEVFIDSIKAWVENFRVSIEPCRGELPTNPPRRQTTRQDWQLPRASFILSHSLSQISATIARRGQNARSRLGYGITFEWLVFLGTEQGLRTWVNGAGACHFRPPEFPDGTSLRKERPILTFRNIHAQPN